MVRKTLHDRGCFEEIISRISELSENSQRKWGKMDAAQMLMHCDLILQIALKKIELPRINILLKYIGILTKIEMYAINNGIPQNMPTFKDVIVNFSCNFHESKENLLKTMDEYWKAYEADHLPSYHVLFGKMTEKDWGFLEYKHLDHHLKQFNV